ncbi:major capsid protein [Chromohalobacter israelensis]|uniref:major capsid protein n=1 Tax=Chromohalobacter israelensis TaxID=141390 RepID=UPI000FFEFC39|nr:major capsid protein [Chromohalobacter salexigens]RXE48708.1 capsid protein [Chromohalobacter salexigens]
MADLFSPRTMLEAIRQMKLARRFLGEMFFGAKPRNFTTEHVDIDIIKGQRKMAPFVRPNRPGRVVDRSGSVMRSYKPPYVKPKMETNAGILLNQRQPGETIYSGRTPLQRAGDQMAQDWEDLDDQISRREEWMRAQALTTGSVNVVGDGVDDIVDFQMSDSHLVTEATAWSEAGADPIADLRKYKRRIAKDSGRTGNVAVLSSEAAEAFLDNETVQQKLNTRRVDLGMIRPQELPDGVTYLGYLNDPGLDLYAYEEWYIDDQSGDEKPMIPAGGLIVGPSNSRCSMLYGAIQDMAAIEGAMFDVARYPKSWLEDDPGVRWMMLQSAPLPGFHEPDAFVYAKVA